MLFPASSSRPTNGVHPPPPKLRTHLAIHGVGAEGASLQLRRWRQPCTASRQPWRGRARPCCRDATIRLLLLLGPTRRQGRNARHHAILLHSQFGAGGFERRRHLWPCKVWRQLAARAQGPRRPAATGPTHLPRPPIACTARPPAAARGSKLGLCGRSSDPRERVSKVIATDVPGIR